MPFERTTVSGTVGATGTLTIPLKWPAAELIGFRAVSTGDTSAIIKLTENAAAASPGPTVVFLDAGTIDYTTAKDRVIGLDTTATGLGQTTGLLDSTGAAASIAGGYGQVIRSPLQIDWSSGTAGDTLQIDIDYAGPVFSVDRTITTPNPAATVTDTFALRTKFAQILGYTNLTTGDNATTVQIKDADNRVVYADAADKDYTVNTLKRMALTYDDTLTSLTPQHLDATGVAATATSAAPHPLVKSPVTVSIVNDSTAGGVARFTLFYRA